MTFSSSRLRHVSLLTSWRVISAVTFPFIVAELIFNLRSNVHKYTYRVLTILPAVVAGHRHLTVMAVHL